MTNIKLGFYRHYKTQNVYQVIGVGKHSETLEDYVIYKPMYAGSTADFWLRPKQMFEQAVEFAGKKVKRFSYLGKKYQPS
jgi:hypothetical protein